MEHCLQNVCVTGYAMLSQAYPAFYRTGDESCECYLCCVRNGNGWKIPPTLTRTHTLMRKPKRSSMQIAIELFVSRLYCQDTNVGTGKPQSVCLWYPT